MMDDKAAVISRLGVSRETADRLEAFAAIFLKWSRALNLVSRTTIPQLWTRHIEDSAQIFRLAPETARHWVDLGAGAGFPGLIVAALAHDSRPDLSVTLIESDTRKAAFLQAAAQAMHIAPTILISRIEAAAVPPADVVSARALAPLSQLLSLAAPILAPGGICLFHKGGAVASELTDAAQHWHSRVTKHRSVTDPTAVILEIQEPTRASATQR